MNQRQVLRGIAALGALLILLSTAALGQQAAKKEYTFHGKVEKVDAQAKTLTVNGEKVVGWMDAMTMTYSVDKEDILKTLKAGDEITAKVYEGDFKVLHSVQVVPPTNTTSPEKK